MAKPFVVTTELHVGHPIEKEFPDLKSVAKHFEALEKLGMSPAVEQIRIRFPE